METWPSSLTGFTDDFSIQPNTVAEKNMTDGGVNHAFSRWTSDIVEISGTLHFGQDDLAVFKTFYRDTIKNGTESFYLTDFPIFGDYETHEVVFKEHPDISYSAWMEWDVSVTLLSSDLGYMTEAAMTALLPDEPDDDYVTFPASVFGEVTDDFGWQQDDLIARGNTDGGDFPFQKRISHVSSTTAQFGIEVSRANMNLFYAWGLYKLAGFKKWFKVELPYGGATQTVTARLIEPPKASFKGRGNADEGLWTISGSLEIYEVNYWALEDCDSLPVRTKLEIVTQPSGVIADVGDSFTLTVSAVGTAPLSYQWYLDGVSISGATASSYYVESATEDDFGSYYVIITDVTGFVISRTVRAGVLFMMDSAVNVTYSGGAVSAWADTQGVYAFEQATSSLQPEIDDTAALNGYAPLRFTNDYLKFDARPDAGLIPQGDFTLSILLQNLSDSSYYDYIYGAGDVGIAAYRFGLGVYENMWRVIPATEALSTSNGGDVALLTVVFEDGTFTFYYNGEAVANADYGYDSSYWTAFYIGSWSGVINESMDDCRVWSLIGWDMALSADEIAGLVSWANSKYGISLT